MLNENNNGGEAPVESRTARPEERAARGTNESQRSADDTAQPSSAQCKARPMWKWETILSAFVQGRSLTRFDAERLGDHCLHTTVAGIETKGVRVMREPAVVPGRFGPIHCKRYRIDPDSIELAHQILAEAACRAA